MEQKILVPADVLYIEKSPDLGTVEIKGCYPGYGSTLGNALRRVLLSSLSGAAITSVHIKNVQHEFSTLDGVKEDIVQIILNLKKLIVRSHVEELVKISLKVKGEKIVTGADFKASSDVEIVNKDHVIATLTDKKTEFDMEVEIQKGIGYVPVEQQNREVKELGVIAIDAIYTPVKRVSFDVENMRVGKQTNYEKVTLEIQTDGSISPKDAFTSSTEILIDQFSSVQKMIQEQK